MASQLDPLPHEHAIVVDLHGFNQVLSRAAIRSALDKLIELSRVTYTDDEKVDTRMKVKSLVLITGVGKNSKHDKGPILKPSVKAFLQSFTPPLVALGMHVCACIYIYIYIYIYVCINIYV